MKPKVLIPLALMAATGGMSGMFAGGKGALLGKAAIGGTGTAGGSMLPFLGEKGLTAATSGLLGTGGKLALGKGTLAKGIMHGLRNPLSGAGLKTYGGLAALGMGMLGDKPEKAEDPIDRKALNQANYNLMRMYGQNAGYTNEDINTIYGPLGEMMGGGHTEVPADPTQRVRKQFPGTNYPIYTTAANGGRIERPGFWLGGLLEKLSGDPEDVEASDNDPYRMSPEEESNWNEIKNFMNYMNSRGLEMNPSEVMDLSGVNLGEGVDRALMQQRIDALLNPEVKANGGRIGFSEGDAVKKGIVVEGDSLKKFDDSGSYIPGSYRRIGLDGHLFIDNSGYESLRHPPVSDFTVGALKEKQRQLDEFRKKYKNAIGDINEVTEPALQEYFDTSSEVEGAMEKAIIRRKLADVAKKHKFDRLASYQKPSEEFIEDIMMDFDPYVDLPSQMNTGGRVHRNIGGIMNAPAVTTPGQAMMPPKGTQWDGRQGGFMPMGEAPQADDVPAMLSKDEFVMTRDAVKAAGNGDVNKGAQVMYDLMNNLEAKV